MEQSEAFELKREYRERQRQSKKDHQPQYCTTNDQECLFCMCVGSTGFVIFTGKKKSNHAFRKLVYMCLHLHFIHITSRVQSIHLLCF